MAFYTKAPELWLLYAVSTYQIIGQFVTTMQEWHAKMQANKTFPNFLVYIQNKYTKQVKCNRCHCQGGLVNVLQAQSEQQIKNMMNMFEKLLTSMQPSGAMSIAAVPPIAPTNFPPCKECPRCNKKH